MIGYLFVLAAGLAAGAVSGTIGTGATIVLLPVLVLQFGPKEAIPIMAIAGLMSVIGKVLAWWGGRSIGGPASRIRSREFLRPHSAHAPFWYCRPV